MIFKEFFMKNVLKAFGIIAIVAVIGFSMAACGGDDGGGNNTGGNTGGNGNNNSGGNDNNGNNNNNSSTTFNSLDDFKNWLNGKDNNSASSPYNVKLNLPNLSGLADFLKGLSGKYVSLDFTGSGLTSIPVNAFYDASTNTGCATLVGITIPNSVTSVHTPLLSIAL